MFDSIVVWPVANFGWLCLLLFITLWLQYIARRDTFVKHGKSSAANGVPLKFPCVLPLMGSLPITYLWKPRDYVLNPDFFQSVQPVLVKILAHEFYVIRGRQNVRALFKNSWACTSIPLVKFALGYAFGLPAKALSLYDKDDSGGGRIPHPGSTVEPRNRIDYRVHESMSRFLEGKGLLPFWARFVDGITQQLHGLHDRMRPEGEERADLARFVGDEATVSIINALCGPYLLSLNSNFLQDFWDFDRNLQTYAQGIPWFLAPRAYAARKRVLDAVKVWQEHARAHFHASAIGSDGDDPFWGSSFFRERQEMFLEMDGYDHTAIASQDFGVIWAIRNSIAATSWALLEIYRDPELLARVRDEVDACALKHEGTIRFDVNQLLRLPVLQAVYAETLRLRMHLYIVRMPDKVDMNVRDWIIPKRKVVVTSTTVAHMDPEAWDTSFKNEHPVNKFWIGRFLKHSPESDSGNGEAPAPTPPEFSTKGLEGSWIPYGGGPRQCPGRHFAKRQILLTTALMVSLFDCEILQEGMDVKEDFTLMGFGSGMSHPAGKVPVRIRQRDRSNK